jgi:peroxiredoxin
MASVMDLGKIIPEFVLNDLDGEAHSLREARGRILVLVFWSAECPWSERADELIGSWQPGWGERAEVWLVASNSNEGAQMLRELAEERKLGIILRDPDQYLADQFGAVTTPHCFVIDEQGLLRYRGAIDNVTFSKREATRFYLNDAVVALLSGKPVDPVDTPSFGCAIVRLNQ